MVDYVLFLQIITLEFLIVEDSILMVYVLNVMIVILLLEENAKKLILNAELIILKLGNVLDVSKVMILLIMEIVEDQQTPILILTLTYLQTVEE